MNEQTFTPEELEELAKQDLECNEQPKLTEGILSTLLPQIMNTEMRAKSFLKEEDKS